MGHIHSVYDTDNHFQINPITKSITDISDSKTLLVQGSHNSERMTFEMPRYIEGHDMSLCNRVQVHYTNVSSNKQEQNEGIYNVEDLQLSPESEDMVICSWLVSKNATGIVGLLLFSLHFMCLEEDEIDYDWNTAEYSKIPVVKSTCNSDIIAEKYPDVLLDMDARIRSTENNVAALANAVRRAETTVADIGNTVGTYDRRINEAVEEVNRVEDRVDSFGSTINRHDSEISRLSGNVSSLDAQVGNLRGAVNSLANRLPEATESDNGKILCVVNGAAAWVSVESAENVGF